MSATPSDPPRLFGFVQLELPGTPGLPDGRHLVRAMGDAEGGGEPEAVIVVATIGAPRRGLLNRRRPIPATPEPPPQPLPVAKITVIEADGLGDEKSAKAWMKAAADSGEALERGVGRINRALHAHRISTADPRVDEIDAEQATVARVGYGAGEQVADGRWAKAVELPPARRRRERRTASLRPQERLAGLLAGRSAPLTCELLVLRARDDLDHGRPREAALQLRIALEAALIELPSAAAGVEGMEGRLEELAAGREGVAAAANAALRGVVAEELTEPAWKLLGRLEAALRARTAAGG